MEFRSSLHLSVVEGCLRAGRNEEARTRQLDEAPNEVATMRADDTHLQRKTLPRGRFSAGYLQERNPAASMYSHLHSTLGRPGVTRLGFTGAVLNALGWAATRHPLCTPILFYYLYDIYIWWRRARAASTMLGGGVLYKTGEDRGVGARLDRRGQKSRFEARGRALLLLMCQVHFSTTLVDNVSTARIQD